jgi:hypothetical protein
MRWDSSISPYIREVKYAWSYTSTPSYIFITWCLSNTSLWSVFLVNHRDNFTFTAEWMIGVPLTSGAKDFYLHYDDQTGSGEHPAAFLNSNSYCTTNVGELNVISNSSATNKNILLT